MLLYHAGNMLDRRHLEIVLHEGTEAIDMSDAGLLAATASLPELEGKLAANRLITYADVGIMTDLTETIRFWTEKGGSRRRLFVDCGAYSVHMRGAVIRLDDYMTFVRTKAAGAEAYVALDVVGDPMATKQNLATMEAEGLSPIPVYTAAAPLSELEALCERYRYIALGGLRGREPGMEAWRKAHTDKVFQVASRYWPVKFHAFGITAQWFLERYPLYSADSSVVVVGGGMGRVAAFVDGRLENHTWLGYARTFGEGIVADGVGAAKSAHMGRRLRSAEGMVALERHVTDSWAARGVTWQD